MNDHHDPFGAISDGEPVFIDTKLAYGLAIGTVFCACLPGGIVALILASSAGKKALAGDEVGARQTLTYSYVVSGLSLAIGIPLSILYIMAQM